MIRPTKSRVLVREDDSSGHFQTSASGLTVILQRKPQFVCGTVLAIGPKAPFGELAVGDQVWFRRSCGWVEPGNGLILLEYEMLEFVNPEQDRIECEQ